MATIEITQKNYLLIFYSAIKVYLSELKIGGTSIPVFIDGHTKEIRNHPFPNVFISNVVLVKDGDRHESGYKYDVVTPVDGEDEEYYTMETPVAMKIEFNLEVADSNPVNFQYIMQLLTQKLKRNPEIEFVYSGEDNLKYPFIVGDPINNKLSRVYHGIYPCSIPFYMDRAVEYVEAEKLTRITINGETVHDIS